MSLSKNIQPIKNKMHVSIQKSDCVFSHCASFTCSCPLSSSSSSLMDCMREKRSILPLRLTLGTTYREDVEKWRSKICTDLTHNDNLLAYSVCVYLSCRAHLVWLIYCNNRTDTWWSSLPRFLFSIRGGDGFFKHLGVFERIKGLKPWRLEDQKGLKC